MWINKPTNEIENQELNNKIKEKQIIKLEAKKSLWDLKDDFETNKEILAYKDQILNEFETLLWEWKISEIVITKINELFWNLNDIEDKYKVLKILAEIPELKDTWEEINKKYIEKILNDYDFVSPQTKMFLWYAMLAVWMLLFSIEWFAASIVLWIWTYWIILWTSQSVDNRHNNTLDLINDIVPDISKEHFDRIQDAIDSSFEDKTDLLLVISEELKKFYKDRVLTDEEITQLEEKIKNI